MSDTPAHIQAASPDLPVDQSEKVDAIEHLQEAACALIEDDYTAFSERLASASKTVNQAAGVPYYLSDAGGPPVAAIGPGIYGPNGHSLWLWLPDEEGPEFDFGYTLNDHLKLLVRGSRKQDPTIRVVSDEHPSTLEIDDSWGKFTDIVRVDGGRDVLASSLFETLAALADLRERLVGGAQRSGVSAEQVFDEVWRAYDLEAASETYARSSHEHTDRASPEDFAVTERVSTDE